MTSLSILVTVVCTIFLFSLVFIPFANADWIMFRSDPSHSGAGIGNPVLTPKLLWKYSTGIYIWSSPVVVGGVVYIAQKAVRV